MHRRRFLKTVGVGGAAALAVTALPRWSQAAGFGEFPTGALAARLPANRRVRRVLEVFLYGGLTPWESFYFVPTYGTAADPEHPFTQLWALESQVRAATSACGLAGADLGQYFADDADGVPVSLGPYAAALWNQPDLLDRMRVLVQRHTLEPHEAAVPQALTGRPVGQPSAAGLGAHVQRHRRDLANTPRAAPWSYVLATGGISSDNVAAAASTGVHPGGARPLLIKTDSAQQFTALLDRTAIAGDRASYDALAKAYADQFQARLRWGGGEPVRSRRTDDYLAALSTTHNVDALKAVFPEGIFDLRNGSACGETGRSIPHTSLEVARHLLTHPSEPAAYVCVSDTGLFEADGGGGYDAHFDDSISTARNLTHVLQGLRAIINGPGETDPQKLSLADTLIILNTEFGRAPAAQDGGGGRNHHPYGYATAMIGGPILAGERGIAGAIGRDGRATAHITPAENRIAALLALDIWPFSSEAFAVSDVPGATSEVEAAQLAAARVLGVVL